MAADTERALTAQNGDPGARAVLIVQRLARIYCRHDGPDVLVSDGVLLWADALRVLAAAGKVVLLRDHGQSVTARWVVKP